MYLFLGALAISSGAFGDDTVSTVVQSVNCYGNETGVLDCSFYTADWGTCLEHSAAVICQGQKGWCACSHKTACVFVSTFVCIRTYL